MEVEAPAPAPSLLEAPRPCWRRPSRRDRQNCWPSRPSRRCWRRRVRRAAGARVPSPSLPRCYSLLAPEPRRWRRSTAQTAEAAVGAEGGVLDGGVFFTPLKTAKPLRQVGALIV